MEKLIVVFVFMVVIVTGFPSDDEPRENECRDNFIKNNVISGTYLKPSEVDRISKTCRPMYRICSGTDNLEVIYVKNNTTNQFLFILESQNLLSVDSKDCWGFALEVYNNEEKFTKYFNFLEGDKKDNFTYYQKVHPGHTYVFTLISLPSGVREKITLKAPDSCGNDLLDYVYTKSNEDDWFTGCKVPDLEQRLALADKVCKGSKTDAEYEEYKKEIYYNSTTCEFVLPQKLLSNYNNRIQLKTTSSAAHITSTNICALLISYIIIYLHL